MLKEFVYTVKLVVQHKLLGTLDFIVQDFNASIEFSENDYFVPFALDSENILTEMASEIDNFLKLRNYVRDDIDFVSYEVSTEDPYIDVFFASEERPEVHNILPQIEVSVIPETFKPATPYNFNAILLNDVIEWSWSGVANCAYRMYDQDDRLVAQIGVDTLMYLETNLVPGKNYTRKITAYNLDGESDPTDFITIEVTAIEEDDGIEVRENTLLRTNVKELEPVEDNVEALEAFKSGVGDNLDLLVNPVEELKVHERFDFDIILEGYRREQQTHYTGIPFTYKVVATGQKYVDGVIDTEIVEKITPWPICKVDYSLKSYIYNPFTFNVNYLLNVKYDSEVIIPPPIVPKPHFMDSKVVSGSVVMEPSGFSIMSFSDGPDTDILNVEADTLRDVETPYGFVIEEMDGDTTISEGSIVDDNTHDPITVGTINPLSDTTAYGEIVDEADRAIINSGIIIVAGPKPPVYETKYKDITYKTSVTLNQPETNKFIADLMAFIKTDADVSKAPDGTVSINLATLIEGDKNVTFSITNNKLYYTCLKNQNFYEYNRAENLDLAVENGKVRSLVQPAEVKLVNAYGNQYSGTKLPTTKITYNTVSPFLTIKDANNNIQPVLITGKYPTLTATMAESTEYYLCSTVFSETQKTKKLPIKEMFPGLTETEYTLQIQELSARGGYEFYTDKTTSFVQDAGSKYIRTNNTAASYLEFRGLPGKALAPWTDESNILSGVVNGKEPMRNNGDGKKDFISVAPYFTFEEEIVDPLFTVVLVETGGKFIDIKCRNQEAYASTKVNGDVLIFSSDETELVDTYGKWTGPIIRTEEWEITTSDVMQFYTNIYNPLYDYSVRNSNISDVRVKAISNNPNVIVTPINQEVIDFGGDEYKDIFKIPFLFEAKILSPSQNAWSPVIMPGYYYVNNDEFFLHAKSEPLGVNSVIAIPETKAFYASVKASIETKADAESFIKRLNSKASFSAGDKDLTIIDESGAITLAKTATTGPFPTYAEKGTYITEPLSFHQTVMLLKVELTAVDKDKVKIYVSGEIGGIWTPWQSAIDGILTNFGDNVERFKVKLELTRSSVVEPYSYNIVDRRKVDWVKGTYEQSNMIIEDGVIALQDNLSPGFYVSPITSVDTSVVETFKLELNTNHDLDSTYDYKLYVATSTSEEGIDSSVALWQEITTDMATPVNAEEFVRYKIEIPANSKIAFNSITKVFDGNATKQSSPIVSAITISSDPPEWMFAGYVTKTILCKVPMDGEIHDVTEHNITDTIYPDILASGINTPRVQNLEIFIVDDTVEISYSNDGLTTLQAKSLVEEYINIESVYINLDENREGELAPIPQLGRPVVAVHKDRGALKHITFFDADGNYTLTNTEEFEYEGRNAIALGYTDIDPASLQVQLADGTEVQVKRIVNNNIYLGDKFVTDVGNLLIVTYKLLNSFTVDYNYDLETNKAKIMVHLQEGLGAEDYHGIEMFYETDDFNDYYATELELNPLYNDISTGFIYLTHAENTPKYIDIKMNPDVFDANGTDAAYIFVKVTDEIGNPVSNTPVQMTSAHGKILITDNITNKFGVVTAKYFSPNYETDDTITAMVVEQNIKGTKKVSVKEPKARIFVTASSVNSVYVVNEGEEVSIEAKVFSEDLVPFMAQDMTLFIANYYGSSVTMKTVTDVDGKAYFSVKPLINADNNTSRIEITCLGIKEYIDIKVVK